jgi:hypothetical protein
MKKILFVLTAITLTIGSCRKSDYVPQIIPTAIDLGNKSTTMNFKSETVQLNNTVSFDVAVTEGSKYSFQIVDFKGDVVLTEGLNADNATEKVTLNISKIAPGAYDLIFIDIQGNEIKKPLIIK